MSAPQIIESHAQSALRSFDAWTKSHGEDKVLHFPNSPRPKAALPNLEKNGRQKFKGMTLFELLNRPRPKWLIKGLVPGASLGMVYGDPAAGKSFALLDMALSLAAGKKTGWAVR